ncbi:hypothetical protein PVAND_015750 [Polypedilum vanderplanki]|uniref:Peptidase S1 domain-containing protein n=1 Tax=Polypedilum vanderplanki TaxID=319348 RepID=A0A9J6BD60_POLVA|nr:hypothetical protein PVAND_015750 [Polypedilum vanderplanki]
MFIISRISAMDKTVLLFLLVLIISTNAQIHLIEIEEFFGDFNSNVRCGSSSFNETAVVIPATCINGLERSQIRVRISQRSSSSLNSSSMTIDGFEIHPNFDGSVPSLNNIAVVTHNMRHSQFQPRNLSKFPSNVALCKIHGLLARGEVLRNYYDDTVTVYPPSHCGYDDPHAHCAVFNSTIHPTCAFRLGSPVSCDGHTTAGFVHTQGCPRRNFTNLNGEVVEAPMMRLTSMSLYHEWINGSNGNFVKSSVFGILIVSLLTIFVGY